MADKIGSLHLKQNQFQEKLQVYLEASRIWVEPACTDSEWNFISLSDPQQRANADIRAGPENDRQLYEEEVLQCKQGRVTRPPATPCTP